MKNVLRVLGTLACIALFAAACSDDTTAITDDDSASDAAETTTTTTAPTTTVTSTTLAPTTTVAQEPGSAIVMVTAHPDDELTISPLLAHYAKAGEDVYLISVTSGDQGGRQTDIPVGDELAAVREAELTAAAEAYGIHEPIFIRNLDGQQDTLEGAEVEDLKAELRSIFEEVGARVVLTFGPDGFTGHADHIAVGAITTELVEDWMTSDDNTLAPERLYWSMFPESFSAFLPDGTDFVGVPDAEATTIVDAGDGVAEAEAAVLAYVTQFPEAQMALVQLLIRDLSRGQVYLRWELAKDSEPTSDGTDILS